MWHFEHVEKTSKDWVPLNQLSCCCLWKLVILFFIYALYSIYCVLQVPWLLFSDDHLFSKTNFCRVAEVANGGVFLKKMFLKISQNSQENSCTRVSFLLKLQASGSTLLKKRLWHRCFPVNFAKCLRTLFLKNTSGGCF